MLKNIFKTALRNILRDKGYSLLNLLGLCISITASLLLILYISHELSYDSFHENKGRIYRIVSHFQERDDVFSWESTQAPLGSQLKTDYPDEVEEYVRLRGMGKVSLAYKDKTFIEEDLVFADSTYFKIFTHTFLSGDPSTCLDEPNSLVFTKSLAIKVFGKTDVVGEIVKDQEGDSHKITAVIEDLPKNTHLDFSGLNSYSSLPQRQDSWGSFFLNTYVMLKKDNQQAVFQPKMAEMITKYVDPIFEQYGVKIEYEMQPVTSIHLYSKTDGEQGGGDISYIYIFTIVVAFMLIIAAINYMNLATARSQRRSKEVGIRKVLGSYHWMLVTQFITESLLLTLSALAISYVIIQVFMLRLFNQMTERSFEMSDLHQPELLLSIIGIIFFLGVLGGSYPAFYLSSFQPVKVLKGKFVQSKGTVPLRKVLVVVQFAISIAMVISTLIVFDQLEFLRNQDLGFNKEKVMVIRYPKQNMLEKYDVLRDKFSKIAGVENIATAGSSPGRGYDKNLLPVETADGFVEKGVNHYPADADFIPTLGIKIVEGRNFDKNLASDSNAVIVNQLFAKRNGWNEPIGKRIKLDDEESIYATVIGVMDDFHQLSLYQEMEPLVFFYAENRPIVHVRFDPKNLKTIEEEMEVAWKEVYPDTPLEKYFLDQNFFKSYEADQKRSDVFTIFSGITIFIACIGLLGLSAFSTQQRRKEIGIRKVIGADTRHILLMLTREFFVLVGISMLFAFGMAYYLMSTWLDETFVYHTQLKPTTFIFSGLIAMVFVILTIGFHAYKAANSNPVDALMTE